MYSHTASLYWHLPLFKVTLDLYNIKTGVFSADVLFLSNTVAATAAVINILLIHYQLLITVISLINGVVHMTESSMYR